MTSYYFVDHVGPGKTSGTNMSEGLRNVVQVVAGGRVIGCLPIFIPQGPVDFMVAISSRVPCLKSYSGDAAWPRHQRQIRSAENRIGPRTRIVRVSPVDSGGVRRSGLQTRDRNSGTCPGVERVRRCDWGNYYANRCWASRSSRGFTSALCMSVPWSTKVWQVDASRSLTPGALRDPDLRHPWGVELTTGQRCATLSHAGGTYRGQNLFYPCSGKGATWLLGDPDRDKRIWTYKTVDQSGSDLNPRYAPGPDVRVKAAFYEG